MIVVAIDIGGTFTDLIGFDQASGQFVQAKSLTTPAQLEQGVTDCIRKSGLAAAAIWLLAPGLFSTITCWPQASVKRCASVRPSASVTPPGAAGTTIVTGLVG